MTIDLIADYKSLTPPILEDHLNWYKLATVQVFFRPTQEVNIIGIKLPKDTLIVFGSANRYDTHFTNPDKFNIDRIQNQYLSRFWSRNVLLCYGFISGIKNSNVYTKTIMQSKVISYSNYYNLKASHCYK